MQSIFSGLMASGSMASEVVSILVLIYALATLVREVVVGTPELQMVKLLTESFRTTLENVRDIVLGLTSRG